MRDTSLWKIVVLPFVVGGALIGTITAATVGIAMALAPEEASVNGLSSKVGRFTFAPSLDPGTLWILDTATGQVRGCRTDDTTLSANCDAWSQA